jgi:hypothetical protein
MSGEAGPPRVLAEPRFAKFRDVDDALVPAVTAAQMREVDRVAVEETGSTDGRPAAVAQQLQHALTAA